ncbi:MAG: PD-(D/E)XK nuclease family protein [Clostridiaceae bacterium]
MSAVLTFLLGRASTGKSERIVRDLERIQNTGGRAILIVPEQYTFEAERMLAEALGGLLGVQVFSFQRLCERILQLQGRTKPFLNAQGCRMVVRRAIDAKRDALKVFRFASEQAGFAEEALGIFQDCKRAGITPDALDALVQKLPPELPLAEKLGDLSILYRETEAYLAERYLSAEDAINAAVELLPESFAAGLPVYIDGVDRPSRQMLQLFETLLTCCPSVTVALRLDCEGSPDDELFEPDRQILSLLKQAGERAGAVICEERLTKQSAACDPLMRQIERNLFAYPYARYLDATKKLTIFGASSRRAEAESLAEAVQKRAREGVRYRDMAVIVSDLDAYAALIRRSCTIRNIPIFLDRKRPLTGHAAVDAALSAVRFSANGYPAADLLRYVKSGYAGCAEGDAEELELYLKRTGVRGNALLKPFTRAKPPEGAERARVLTAGALGELAKGLARATVSEQVRALYAFLQSISLEQTLKDRAEQLKASGRVAEMEEHAQVWNLLIELLDQLDSILGNLRVGRKGLLSLLEEGFGGGSVGVVPGTADQGLIGDVVRTRSRTVKALFVVGANEGMLPRPQQNDGIIDERDLLELKQNGAPLRYGAQELGAYDRLDLYTALSKTTETLYVSFAYGDGSAELAPAPMVERLKQICPNCELKTDIESTDELPDCEARALTLIASDLRRFRQDGVVPERLPALIELLTRRNGTRDLVLRMLQESASRFGERTIGEQFATALYGKSIPMSASRLESFNNCPFQHFVRYGLGAAETLEYTERMVDLGEFFHAALEAFVNAVNEQKLNWKLLSDETALSITDDILPGVIAEHNYGILLENERLKATLFLLIETVKQSALAVTRQLRAGSFEPIATEARFGVGQPFPPICLALPDGREALVGGKIDRIDSARVSGGEYLRVIDYKTGGKDFDFSGVLQGLTLQLPLYLTAASKGASRRAGMYYMPVTQPAVSDSEEDIEGAVADAFRLQGLTVSNIEVLRASDNTMSGASSVLYKVERTGEEAYAGSVCSTGEMEELLALARKKSEETLERMMSGEMTASPAARKKNRPACEYCDYNSVCRFDPATPGCTVRLYKTVKQADFFKLIAGGEADALDE